MCLHSKIYIVILNHAVSVMRDLNDIGPRVVDLKGTKSQLHVKVMVSVSAQMSVIQASGFFLPLMKKQPIFLEGRCAVSYRDTSAGTIKVLIQADWMQWSIKPSG